jgi:hypothetical protein
MMPHRHGTMTVATRRPQAYIPSALARELAARHQIDPRSLAREAAVPGSVRGMAGDRARAALAELQAVAGRTPETTAI